MTPGIRPTTSINFSYGEDSDGQIVLHFAGPPGKGDRQDVATVKSVMVQYFKGLRDISYLSFSRASTIRTPTTSAAMTLVHPSPACHGGVDNDQDREEVASQERTAMEGETRGRGDNSVRFLQMSYHDET